MSRSLRPVFRNGVYAPQGTLGLPVYSASSGLPMRGARLRFRLSCSAPLSVGPVSAPKWDVAYSEEVRPTDDYPDFVVVVTVSRGGSVSTGAVLELPNGASAEWNGSYSYGDLSAPVVVNDINGPGFGYDWKVSASPDSGVAGDYTSWDAWSPSNSLLTIGVRLYSPAWPSATIADALPGLSGVDSSVWGGRPGVSLAEGRWCVVVGAALRCSSSLATVPVSEEVERRLAAARASGTRYGSVYREWAGDSPSGGIIAYSRAAAVYVGGTHRVHGGFYLEPTTSRLVSQYAGDADAIVAAEANAGLLEALLKQLTFRLDLV